MSIRVPACGLVAALVCLLAPVAVSPALAQARCVVADPSGTPLNVRAAPGGAILGALHNGAVVRLHDAGTDEAGRVWAYVAPRVGKAGWVYRRFIVCD